MDREVLVRRALILSVLSITISGVAGLLAVVVGLATNALALLGFGFDAAIDSVASIALVWRFRIERTHPARAERAERIAERIVGAVLLVLATYLVVGAVRALASNSRPETTPIAIAIPLASVILLPPLAIAKRRVADRLGSGALRGDSILTGIAAVLALVSLAGFWLTRDFGVTWADAVGGLVAAIVLVREGTSAFGRRGLAE